MRDPESLAKEKYLSTVCDVLEIYSKALKEAIVRVFVSADNTSKGKRIVKKD